MKKPCCKKGFTLIELLIVIAIIGILAVALLPSIFGAPAKGRDAARMADLSRMQKIIMAANLDGQVYPTSSGAKCADEVLNIEPWLSQLGGKVPTDPQQNPQSKITTQTPTCDGKYVFKSDPNGADIDGSGPLAAVVSSKTYSFGLYAHAENCTKDVVSCTSALGGAMVPSCSTTDLNDRCFAVLVK